MIEWFALAGVGALIVVVVKRINRDTVIYHQEKVKFREWLHQFDDPETGD